MANSEPVQAGRAVRRLAVANSGPAGAVAATVAALLLYLAPSTPAALIALTVLVAALAVRPFAGIILLGFALPFYLTPRSFGSMAFSMPELILLSTLAAATIRIALRRKPIASILADLPGALDGPAALFLGAALLSLATSQLLRLSLRELRTVILEPLAAYYLAAWLLRDRDDPLRLSAALLAGGAMAAAMGIYQFLFTDYVVAVEGTRRILGPYLSPNNLGLYLGRTLPVALALVLYLPRWRWAAAILLVILCTAQLLTFSLGAWLASTITMIAVLLLWRPKAAPGLAVAALALVTLAALLLGGERIASHFSLQGGTSFIRLQLWQSSLEMIRDHPILGVGLDNFLYQYRTAYLLPGAAMDPNLSHPHNLVLNFWLELGIPGLGAIVWLLTILAGRWRRLWNAPLDAADRAVAAGAAGALLDILVHGMIDNSYFLVDLAFHFWLVAAIIVVLSRRYAAPALSRSG